MSVRRALGLACVTVLATISFTAESRAATIIADAFTVANGSFIPGGVQNTGKAPVGTNLPGGNYLVTGGGGGDGRYFSNTAEMHNGGGVAIQLGSYNDSTVLTASADISFNNVTAPVQATGYALLGFSTVAGNGNYSPSSPVPNFTGLRVNLDGSVALVVQGSIGSAIAYGGTYTQATPQRLSYTVNTTTGAISDITFGSSTASYNFVTTGITNARTELFGIGGSVNNTQNYARFDNLLLETAAVPEPAAIGLVAALAPLALRRRSR